MTENYTTVIPTIHESIADKISRVKKWEGGRFIPAFPVGECPSELLGSYLIKDTPLFYYDLDNDGYSTNDITKKIETRGQRVQVVNGPILAASSGPGADFYNSFVPISFKNDESTTNAYIILNNLLYLNKE